MGVGGKANSKEGAFERALLGWPYFEPLSLAAPVAVIVVIIWMIAAIKPRTSLEVGAAAPVDPNAAIIVAPRLAEDARSLAALAD